MNSGGPVMRVLSGNKHGSCKKLFGRVNCCFPHQGLMLMLMLDATFVKSDGTSLYP